MAQLDLSNCMDCLISRKKSFTLRSYDVLFAEETKPSLEGFEKGQVTELGAVN